MAELPYLIVTNDDGVDAPGLLALAQAMRTFARVRVVAPTVNHSAAGHKKTLFQDIPVRTVLLADGSEALSVSGSPADCVALAALGLVEWPPTLVVSGINRGANLGQDITSSGTVTAALEASINGAPAIAVSVARRNAMQVEDYAEAARVASVVVQALLARIASVPLMPHIILNLNIPDIERVKGIRIVRQGIRIYNELLEHRPGEGSDGEALYRIVGPEPGAKTDDIGTDVWAVHRGYASLTPIHLDMTAHRLIADLGAWDLQV